MAGGGVCSEENAVVQESSERDDAQDPELWQEAGRGGEAPVNRLPATRETASTAMAMARCLTSRVGVGSDGSPFGYVGAVAGKFLGDMGWERGPLTGGAALSR